MNSIFYTALDLIKAHEGLRLKPYYDTEKNLTIGYGRLLERGISIDEAELMLKNDLEGVMLELSTVHPYRQLDPVRQCVLLDMCFNLGLPRLLQFRKMWTAIRLGQYEIAANEMLDSRWAKQVGIRAHRLSEMMRRGAG